jgi:GNAT superfamily N-acetyltransferase
MKPIDNNFYVFNIWDESKETKPIDIISAIKRAHGIIDDNCNENYFMYKFCQSPFGKAIVGYINLKDKPHEVCGCVAYGRYEMIIEDKICKVGIAYASSVVEEYRGQGLFKSLIKYVIEKLKTEKFDFLINFPNSKSIQGYKSTGWNASTSFTSMWLRPASLARVPNIMFHFKDIFKPYINLTSSNERKSTIREKIESLNIRNFEINSNDCFIIPNRLKCFYKWRLVENKQNFYGVVQIKDGYCMYKKGRRGRLIEIQILDFYFKGGQTLKKMRLLYKGILKNERPDLISVNISKDNPLANFLRMTFFFKLKPNKEKNFSYYIINENLKESLLISKWLFFGIDAHVS